MKSALYARFSSDLQRAASIEDQFKKFAKTGSAQARKCMVVLHVAGSNHPRPSQETGTKTGTNCYFGPGTNGVCEKKSPMKSMVGVMRFALFLQFASAFASVSPESPDRRH